MRDPMKNREKHMNDEVQKGQGWNWQGKRVKMPGKWEMINQPTNIGNDHIQNRTKPTKWERKQEN